MANYSPARRAHAAGRRAAPSRGLRGAGAAEPGLGPKRLMNHNG